MSTIKLSDTEFPDLKRYRPGDKLMLSIKATIGFTQGDQVELLVDDLKTEESSESILGKLLKAIPKSEPAW